MTYNEISNKTGLSNATLRKRAQRLRDRGLSVTAENLTSKYSDYAKTGRPELDIPSTRFQTAS